jgi:hypothetical protein
MSSSINPTSGIASMMPGIATVIPGTATNIGHMATPPLSTFFYNNVVASAAFSARSLTSVFVAVMNSFPYFC